MSDQLNQTIQQNDYQKNPTNFTPSNKEKGQNTNESKENEFAFGFPDWSLTPPNQVIKRVRR